MDDLVQLSEGIRAAAATVVSGPELYPLHDAIDGVIEGFRWALLRTAGFGWYCRDGD